LGSGCPKLIAELERQLEESEKKKQAEYDAKKSAESKQPAPACVAAAAANADQDCNERKEEKLSARSAAKVGGNC